LTRQRSGIERLYEVADATGMSAVVFMAFVALGSVYILLAKLAGVGQFYVTFVPVGIMLAYAALIFLARNLRLRDDQSGDNLYYMGFLFTLTSLGVSLYQFSAEHAAEDIVQNFGIAIGSTIAGIGLRVVFNQMRRDPVEVERMMRLELAEAARRVRRELDSTVVEFGYHRRSAQQAAADSFKQVAERFDEIVAKFDASLKEITGQLAQPLEAASRHSGDTLGELSKTLAASLSASAQQFGAETDKLAIRVRATAIKLDEVIAKLGAIETPESAIKAGLEPIAQSISQSVESLSERSNSDATAIKDALTTSTQLIATMFEQFKIDSKAHVELLRALLAKTDDTMRTFTDVLIRSGVDATLQAEGLREAIQATQVDAQTLVQVAEKISQTVEDLQVLRLTPRRERVD
jgi:Mg2+ and Co2+ transporter CorA